MILSKAGFLYRLLRGPLPWLLSLLIILFYFYLYPVIDVIRYTFTDAKMTSNEYVYTFRSYINVFTSQTFYQSLRRTFIFVSISVVFQFLLGFAIAYAVDHEVQRKAKGTLVTRIIALVSWAIPGGTQNYYLRGKMEDIINRGGRGQLYVQVYRSTGEKQLDKYSKVP
jgi:multiple sugar transport system permease protein